MSDPVRQQLQTVLQTHGRGICEEPQRCEALLRDLCGEHRREIHVLISALKERIVVDLRAANASVPLQVLVPRLSRRLENNLGLSSESARWAVESWALALGLITSAELTRQSPTPPAHAGAAAGAGRPGPGPTATALPVNQPPAPVVGPRSAAGPRRWLAPALGTLLIAAAAGALGLIGLKQQSGFILVERRRAEEAARLATAQRAQAVEERRKAEEAKQTALAAQEAAERALRKTEQEKKLWEAAMRTPRPAAGSSGLPAVAVGGETVIQKSWIICVNASPSRHEAEAKLRRLQASGFPVGVLWIPDYGSLSEKPLWLAYVGPVPYGDRETARKLRRRVQASIRSAYAVKLDRRGPREMLGK